MSITSKDMLDLLYYRKLPQVYRDEDKKLNYPLKRYLESLIEGGYYGSIKDIEDMMLLIDPETIPEEFFPYLYESFGLTYFPDIDISYQRKFLMNIGEILKRRGTFACVRYLARTLTGLDVELSYSEGTYNGVDGNYLVILLVAEGVGQIENLDTNMEILNRFIRTQLPYYITPVVTARVGSQTISSKSYAFSTVGTYKSYTISKHEEGN